MVIAMRTRDSDLTGQTYGRLSVLKYSESKSLRGSRGKKKFWLCRCECGATVEKPTKDLRAGKVKSCGCLALDERASRSRHGHSVATAIGPSRTYKTWQSMKHRCASPNNVNWLLYGGRGITVCERWQSFEGFLEDMGERPHGMSIDRIDSNKGYEKSNCRWASADVQVQNTTRTKLTVDLVNEIRGRAEHGESFASIARRFKVSGWNVSAIVKRKTWRNVS